MATNNSWNSDIPIVIADGGTGSQSLTGVVTGNGTSALTATAVTEYSPMIGGATNAVASVGIGTSGQLLQSKGAGVAAAYSTATYPATTTVSQLLYSSATNTVAGLATANNGVVITSATGVPSVLVAGTTGQVLTATTGSPATWAAAAGGGGGAWEYVSTTTISSDATIDFTLTGVAYMVVLDNVLPADDGESFRMLVSNDAGSSFVAVDYQSCAIEINSGVGTAVSSGSANATYFPISSNIGTSTAEYGINGILTVAGLNDASNPASTAWNFQSQDGLGYLEWTIGGGITSDNGNTGATLDVDAIRFLFDSGNLASGTMYLYKQIIA